jgi:hypothetical protein
MKYSFLFSVLILILFSVLSCNRILDNYFEKEAQQNYTSPYMGKWVGTYNGEESGTLSITVAKSGSILGIYGQEAKTFISNVFDDGSILPVNSDDPMFFILYGSLYQKKGTWKKSNLQGTWTLTKQ